MAYPRNGPASRAVALDLMLRTFMNSADFHPSNPKIWENIAKLVPGTTPQQVHRLFNLHDSLQQIILYIPLCKLDEDAAFLLINYFFLTAQCAQRWEELRMSSLSIAGDFSGLTATGRPISGSGGGQGKRQMTRYVRSMFSQQINAGASPSRGAMYNTNSGGSHGNVMKSPSGYHYSRQLSGNSNQSSSLILERPGSSIAMESATLPHHIDEPSSGKFVANFFQTHLSGGSGGGCVAVGGAKGGHGRDEKSGNEDKSIATEGTRY